MKAFLLATALVLLLPGGSARADDDLYKAKNCFACHRVDRNHLGPSFRNIAARYADDKEAESKLAKRVREGGVGVWGQVPMPAQPALKDEDARVLARWIVAGAR